MVCSALVGFRRGESLSNAFISIDEDGPTDVVAANLIFYHKLSNRIRKLSALPFALGPSCLRTGVIGSLSSFDRVRGGAEVMLGNMTYAGGLTRGVGREPSGSPQWPCRPHRVPADRSSLHHLHPAICPCAGRLDRLARARVRRDLFLEDVQHVFRTRGGPQGQKLMISVGERAAAADRHQARVADSGKDHAHTPSNPSYGGTLDSSVLDRGCVASAAHELLVDCAAGSVVERSYVKCWLG
jgi:hypothetical protein